MHREVYPMETASSGFRIIQDRLVNRRAMLSNETINMGGKLDRREMVHHYNFPTAGHVFVWS